MATDEVKASWDVMNLDVWYKDWESGQIGFHMTVVNELLVKNYERLCDGKTGLRWLLPLCGKSVDLKWLADKGHTAVGIECAGKAAEEFFVENNIKFTVSDVPEIENCKLYKCEDGNILFYVCDYFKASNKVLGLFDVVWDRGSLNVMPIAEAPKYMDQMKTFFKSETKILLDLFEFVSDDGTPMKGQTLLEDDVRKLYGENCSFEVLGTYKFSEIIHLHQAMSEGGCQHQEGEGAKDGNEEVKHGDGHFGPDKMIGRTYLIINK